MNCEDIIKELSKFLKDKPVKVLAYNTNYDEDYPEEEDISEIGYAQIFNDEFDENTGQPIFHEDLDTVYIFTKNYNDMMLMNGV